MNNLEIYPEKLDDLIVLKCKGRLDANWAGHLNDHINRLVRDGNYHISLDMTEIEYLSSAGIRSLVTQMKNMKAVNGHFFIRTMSEVVEQVLTMVGMYEMLTQEPGKSSVRSGTEVKKEVLSLAGYRLQYAAISGESALKTEFYGQPELVSGSGFSEINARKVDAEADHYAFGLGAIGHSYEDCKNRFGEYLMVGKNIAYLPADGTKKPDYMVSSGKLVASLTEMYGLHMSGTFTHLIRFDPENPGSTIRISDLIDGIMKLTGFDHGGFLIITESAGLIGTSLNVSPTGGKRLFTYPEIKETVNFTTEYAHQKMLVIAIGYFSDRQTEDDKRFLRPFKTGSSCSGHIHAAVFPYIPLKKTGIGMNETIDSLFETAELTDILHLANDTREIAGLGESQLVHGFCWVAKGE